MEEDIRHQWCNARFVSNDAPLSEVLRGRCTTALERLGRRYRCFVTSGLLMLIFMPLNLSRLGIIDTGYIIGFELICLVCVIVDMCLWYKIRGIDCLTMSVREVLRRSQACRKLHLRSVFVLLPCAMVFVGMLMVQLPYYAQLGAAVGGCVGLIVGVRQLLRFLADYREVAATPVDDEDEEA